MRITRRQLRNLIREALSPQTQQKVDDAIQAVDVESKEEKEKIAQQITGDEA